MLLFTPAIHEFFIKFAEFLNASVVKPFMLLLLNPPDTTTLPLKTVHAASDLSSLIFAISFQSLCFEFHTRINMIYIENFATADE